MDRQGRLSWIHDALHEGWESRPGAKQRFLEPFPAHHLVSHNTRRSKKTTVFGGALAQDQYWCNEWCDSHRTNSYQQCSTWGLCPPSIRTGNARLLSLFDFGCLHKFLGFDINPDAGAVFLGLVNQIQLQLPIVHLGTNDFRLAKFRTSR